MRPNLWFLLPLTVLISAAVAAWQRDRVPARTDWLAAASAVRAGLAPGDVVIWAPYTQGEAKVALEGLPLLHARDLGQVDLSRYDRLWLLGSLGHGPAELPPGHTVQETLGFGRVTLSRVGLGGPKVVGDLYAHLEDALYTRHAAKDGAVRLCDFWSGQGWHCDLRDPPETTRACLGQPIARRLDQKGRDPDCGLNPWLHVSRDVRLIGDTPRRCLWMHPMAEAAVRLTWNDAPAGDTLVVDFGFSDPMVADNYQKQLRVQPASLKVLRAGVELAVVPVPATKGWRRFETRLPEGAAPLAFELTSRSTTDAHFCFDPTVRVDTRPEAR